MVADNESQRPSTDRLGLSPPSELSFASRIHMHAHEGLRGDLVPFQYRFVRHAAINLQILPITFLIWPPERRIRYWLICMPIFRCGGRSGLNVGLRCDGTGWS
jgi:hypothetical protein